MANLKFTGLITGSAAPRVQRLPIKTEADIDEGTIIALDNTGKFTVGTDENTKCIIGTVACDYKCAADEFNPENGSGLVRVNISGDSVYALALPVFTCSADSENACVTVEQTEYASIAQSVAGGSLIFNKKGEASNCSLNVGDKVEIASADATDGNLVITLSDNCTIGAGDTFTFVPQLGYDALSEKNGKLLFDGEKKSAKVIGCDDAGKNAYVVLCDTFIA